MDNEKMLLKAAIAEIADRKDGKIGRETIQRLYRIESTINRIERALKEPSATQVAASNA
jgi:hypothetical protein